MWVARRDGARRLRTTQIVTACRVLEPSRPRGANMEGSCLHRLRRYTFVHFAGEDFTRITTGVLGVMLAGCLHDRLRCRPCVVVRGLYFVIARPGARDCLVYCQSD